MKRKMEETKNLNLGMTNIIKCPICTKKLNNSRMLPCLHTFCLECLISYDKKHKGIDRSLCPVCRCAFAVPEEGYSNLKRNAVIDKMIKAGTEFPDQKLPVECEVCENQPGGTAKFRCEDCAQNMCEQCCKVHGRMKMSKSHEVITLSNGENLNIEASQPEIGICKQHKQEMRFYCRDCDKVACSKCLLDQHEKHRIFDVNLAADELRKNIRCHCDAVNLLLGNVEKQMRSSKEMLKEYLETAGTAEKDIIEKGETIKRFVDRNVSMLLDNVKTHKLKIRDDFEKEFEKIQRNKSVLGVLRNYCEQIIQSADINDLLLVKEDLKTQVCGLMKEIDTQVEAQLAIEFIPTDGPITEEEDRMTNPQRNIIGSICVSRGMCKSVQGLTASDDELFVVLNKSSDIHVYDVQQLTYRRRIQVPKLMDPCDIAYSEQVLFVSESEEQSVHMIELQSGRITQTKIPGRTLKLSVDPLGSVVVTSFDPAGITILTPDNFEDSPFRVEKRSYEVEIWEKCLHHAIGLKENLWAVAFVRNTPHGTTRQSREIVPAIYKIVNKGFRQATMSVSGCDSDYRQLALMLDSPCYLELYDSYDRHVLAADRNNNRIVKIDFKTLKIVDVVLPASTGLVRPFTFCLNHNRDTIYVVDNRNQILMFRLECKRDKTPVTNQSPKESLEN